MATKVGEGYIEIVPRLTGFNRDLLRDVRRRIRDLQDVSREARPSINVAPKITGITKAWQREVQRELNEKIQGLTVNVTVKLKNDALKATFNEFTVEAKRAGANAGQAAAQGFDGFVSDVKRDMREAEIAIKEGVKAFDDKEITRNLQSVNDALAFAARNTKGLSDSQVTSLRQVVNEHQALNKVISTESKKAAKDFEDSFKQIIRQTDELSRSIDRSNTLTRKAFGKDWNFVRGLEDELKAATGVADDWWDRFNRLARRSGEESSRSFSSAFGRSLRSNLYDNVSEGLLSLIGRFIATALSAQPLLTLFSNLAGAMTILATGAVDLYGTLAALPAAFGLVAQATAVLTAAFTGVGDALTALGNEEQHAARNADTQARQIAAAQERVAEAKERLKQVIETENAQIKAAEESLAKAKEAAAKRIVDAEKSVAEAREAASEALASANERIVDAQRAVARAYEAASDRIASAEKRHVQAIERVKEAQLDLNQAYKDALQRFEDLNQSMSNAILSEEGARLAIERAKERLDKVLADEESSDLDKREADFAYRQALERLDEVRKRQSELQKEVDEANRSGVEGSKEVTDAKKRLLDAIESEREAQAAIAKAHQDAAEQITDAQERVSRAQADAVKAQLDAAKRVQDAEDRLAEARKKAAEDVEDAQKRLKKTQDDSARSIIKAQRDIEKAIANLAEAQNKQNAQWYNAQYALSQISPEARKFVEYLNDRFLPKLQEVQFKIQDAFYPPILEALQKSEGLLDFFGAKLVTTSGIFGELIGKTIEWLDMPETRNRLGEILDTNNRAFQLLGEAGLNFGDALLIVAEEAGPFIEAMSKLVLDFSKWVTDILNSEEGRKELRKFFENVESTIKNITDILGPLASALYGVYTTARPYLDGMFDRIKDIVNRFDKWVNSPEGKTQLEKWLENGGRVFGEILKLIEDIAKAFFDLGANGDMASVIRSLREDLLPAVINVIRAFGFGEEGGGFIFVIKLASQVLNFLAFNITAVGLAFSLVTGDIDGAKAAAYNMVSVLGDMGSTFETYLPDSFARANDAVKNWARTNIQELRDGQDSYNAVGEKAKEAANKIGEGAGIAKGHVSGLTENIKENSSQWSSELDSKTRDAKDKATANTKAMADISKETLARWREESKTELERVVRATDEQTAEAGRVGQDNVWRLINRTDVLLSMMPNIFDKAGRDSQQRLRNQQFDWSLVSDSLVNGLIEGVKRALPGWLTTVWNLGVEAVNTVRRALDSHSPSRKMVSVGQDIGSGLVIGIESMSSKVSKASKKLAESVTDSFGNPLLDVQVGMDGRKAVPTIGAAAVATAGPSSGPRNVNYITVHGAPNIPTERQISNILKYQDSLYGNDS